MCLTYGLDLTGPGLLAFGGYFGQLRRQLVVSLLQYASEVTALWYVAIVTLIEIISSRSMSAMSPLLAA